MYVSGDHKIAVVTPFQKSDKDNCCFATGDTSPFNFFQAKKSFNPAAFYNPKCNSEPAYIRLNVFHIFLMINLPVH